MEFEIIGNENKDGLCPHCGHYYEEDKLDEILSFDQDTDFQCDNCSQWIRGFKDFEVFSADVEYFLVDLKPK